MYRLKAIKLVSKYYWYYNIHTLLVIGSLGTDNRVCNDTSTDGGDSCDTMCCGRGYTSKTVQETINCGCKFQWCCHVKCKSCTVMQDRHTCLPASNNINRSNRISDIIKNSANRNRWTLSRGLINQSISRYTCMTYVIFVMQTLMRISIF